jgi:hypothetical protein
MITRSLLPRVRLPKPPNEAKSHGRMRARDVVPIDQLFRVTQPIRTHTPAERARVGKPATEIQTPAAAG